MNTDQRKAVVEQIQHLVEKAGGVATVPGVGNHLLRIEFPNIECLVFAGQTAESGLFLRWSSPQRFSNVAFEHVNSDSKGLEHSAMTYLVRPEETVPTLAPILRAIQNGTVFRDRRVRPLSPRDGRPNHPR